MKNSFLHGERIYLRTLTEEDAEGSYIQWLNDAGLCNYNSHHVFPYSKDSAVSYIKSSLGSRSSLILAVVVKNNNVHIGNISLQNINYISRNAEFAILLGEKDYLRKGYAKEAANLIVGHGFMELNLFRIYCGTSADNIPMQKLALSLGMREEGRRRSAMFKHGQYVDMLEYGLLKNEFLET